jgi:holo-[acyl-carrier protein] synthase
MIYGIGTDIVHVPRIEAALTRNGDSFAERVLGADEMAVYLQRKSRLEARGIRFLATRFAAKEAFSKAAGLGMRAPMAWRAMQVLNDANGKPMAVTSGELDDFMKVNSLSAQVSITDESDYAVAFVILEKE